MGRFFEVPFKKGMPISIPGFARGIMRMAEAWERCRIIGGRITWDEALHIPTIRIDGLNEPYPFKVTDNGGGSISVKGGSWTRNGITVTRADLTLSNVGTEDYIYIQLDNISVAIDASQFPNYLNCYYTSILPDDILGLTNAGYNRYCILGKFTGGVWEQYWKGGHIDDLVLRPDCDKYSDTGRNTIQRNPESGGNQNYLQVGDVHSVKASALSIPFFSSNDTIPKQGAISWAALDAHELATPTHKSIEIVGTATGTAYAQIVGFRAPATPTDPFATDAYTHHFGMRETNGTLTAMKWYDFDTFVDGLETKVKADLLEDSEWLDDLADALDISSTHTGLDFSGSTSAKGTGLSGGNTDHDDSYWHEFGTDFVDTKTFKTSGEVWTAGFKIYDDDSNNYWTKNGFYVESSGEATIKTKGNDISIIQGAGTEEIIIGSRMTLRHRYDIFLETEQLTLDATNIKYGDTDQGVSITNWTTKGGLTGTDIIEVSADEIQPTDKVLVRRA